jgi:light-regulated signal transduction histidine kinase (bacteriophytochrome)
MRKVLSGASESFEMEYPCHAPTELRWFLLQVTPFSWKAAGYWWSPTATSDTGIGISAEQQQLLFEPFTQADQGLTRRFTGTGIGLAYVRKMVSLLGGQILVESEPGRGSRFTVTLPVSNKVGS